MKTTKVFSALLAGTMILAGCSNFAGTEGSFGSDLTSKYQNNDSVILNGKAAALTVRVITGWEADNEDSEKVTSWKITLKFSDSLKSTDGISLLKASGTDEKKPLSVNTYAGTTIAFDKADPTQKTVNIVVSGKEMPKDYLIKVDAQVTESVAGKKLDGDGDSFWGETEDSYYNGSLTEAIGYLLTGTKTWNLSWNVSYNAEKEAIEVSTLTPESNKAVLDANFYVETYNASTDTWTSIETTRSYDKDTSTYKMSYKNDSYVPVRVCCKDIKDVKLNIWIVSDAEVSVPYTTDKYDTKSTASFNVVAAAGSSSFYRGYYVNPDMDNLSGSFWFTRIGNGVYELSLRNDPAIKFFSVSKDKTVSVKELKTWDGVDVSSIKFYVNGAQEQDYVELKPESVEIFDETSLRFTFADKEKNFTANDKLTIVATPAVKMVYEDAEDEDKTVSLSLGHLCVASSTLTKGGNTIIFKN